ncbi:MAG: hypothetical protein JWN72_1890 [Thermoleophilia bacterium]|nr:hypothetical protein [Thermoleophilia bacterium]
MTRRILTPLVALLAVLVAATAAQAHTAQVLPRGSAELSLGTDPGSQLIHAVLVAPRDTLTVNLVVPRGEFAVEVLVPDQPQERKVEPPISFTYGAKAVAAGEKPQPSLTSTLDYATAKTSRVRKDAATGIRYRQLLRFDDSDGLAAGTVLTIRVERGATPLRVAVRTDIGGKFALDDAKQVPKTVSRLGAWFTQPAAGAPRVGEQDLGDGFRGLVWIPITIAGLMVLTALWWMLRGLRTARARGVERAVAERDDAVPPPAEQGDARE